jgi:uncharacterized protein YbcI
MDERLGDPADPTAELRLAGSVAATISREMVRMMSRYTGRGPTKARTSVDANVVVVVLEDTLTRGELNLVAAGQAASVEQMRRSFHSLMRDEAVEMVQGLTGRRVTAVLSDIDTERNVAAQLFVLDRRPDTGVAATVEVEGPEDEEP